MHSSKLACTILSVSAALAAPAIPSVNLVVPTTGASFAMPAMGSGSCCGSYNISSWIDAWLSVAPNVPIHIDTSCDYGSEPDIAAAIAASGLPRNRFWITSKLNVESIAADMTSALQQQVLTPLNMSYVDLLLLHHAGRWETDPNPRPPCFNASGAGTVGTYAACRIIALQAMEALRVAGLVRAWGVSNWNVRDLLQAKAALGYYPPINQIEFHPYWQAREVVSFCNRAGILVEAYAPFGDYPRSPMLADPTLNAIAATHGLPVGQVVLAWELSVGADVVIPRSASLPHQISNVNLFAAAVTLNETETAAIASLAPYSKVYHTDCQPWC